MKTKKLLLVSAFLFFAIQFGFAQNKISGTVTNASDGSPIPGVNVLVQGGNSSTSTGVDGRFTIDAAQGNTITFSYVGFLSKNVKANSNQLNVALLENANTLDQVVVIGSTVKTSRKELGNAITSVKSKDLLRAQPNSLSAALQGKVAGAQISQNSGDPAGGFSIKLRGTSSILGSSDPLYVIDGVIMSNVSANLTNLDVGGNTNVRLGQNRTADINPNDIESVEVLNGGAAAAIYGSRASNGVVLITTKKGKEGATKYTFSTNTVVNKLRKKLETNLLGKQFKSAAPSLFPISTTPGTGDNFVTVRGRNFDKTTFDVQRYDYQDDIFNVGVGTDTYFSLNGGNEKTKYFTSVGYLQNEGIIRNTDFTRIGLNLKVQQKISSKLSASFGLNYITSTSNEKSDGNRFWSPLNSVTINNNIYDLAKTDANGEFLAVDPGRVSPASAIYKIKNVQDTDRIISDVQLNFKPFKNFSADLIVGLDNINQKGFTFIPRYPYSGVNPAFFDNGYASEATNRILQVNNDLNLRYLWQISKDFSATTTAGYNVQLYRDKFYSIAGRDLKPFVETINAPNTIIGGGASTTESKFNLWGFFIQETFGFKNKLFLTGAIRQDASTTFSKEKRTQIYPKVSASYVLSNEDIFKDSFASTIRFRASWGESGSLTAIGPYSRFTNYTTGNIAGSTTFSIEGDGKGNLDLVPEKSATYEVGADFGFFDDRFTIAATYYNADIENLLLRVQSAASSGATNSIRNLGEMNNKGFELGLKFDAIRKDDINLDFFVNYSTNKNKVTGLNQKRYALDSNPAGAPVFIELDSPIGIYYGTYYATNPDGSLLLTTAGYPQTELGDIASGTSKRDPITGQPTGGVLTKQIGDPNPDYIISFGTNLRYKKWGMSVLFDGVQGVDVWDADYRTRQGVGSGTLVKKELTGELPRGYIWSIYDIQQFRVVDGSYIKLREVAVNYSFGKLNNFFDDLTVNFSGRNLYSWDKFTSYDPEVNSGGQSSVAKYNFGAIPIPLSVALGFKFQF